MEADYENKKKLIKKCAENLRSIVKDLLSVLPGCNKSLLAIADHLDTFHKGATIASVTGSSLGIAGGIATLAGMALAPFTLGASLVVSGIGLGAAVAGGVTGAGATIADIVNMKNNCSEADDIIKKVDGKLKAFEMTSKELQSLVKALDAMEITAGIANQVKNVALAGLDVARTVQVSKLSAIAEEAAQIASRGLRVASAVIGILAALFIAIDAVSLVKGVQELSNDTKTEAATEIRKYAEELKKLHQDMKWCTKDLL